jgi:hypothetical protein
MMCPDKLAVQSNLDVLNDEQTENKLTIPIDINNIFQLEQWLSRYDQYTTV